MLLKNAPWRTISVLNLIIPSYISRTRGIETIEVAELWKFRYMIYPGKEFQAGISWQNAVSFVLSSNMSLRLIPATRRLYSIRKRVKLKFFHDFSGLWLSNMNDVS